MDLYAWCTSFTFIASVALISVSSALPSHQAVCAWDEYYDENMDNCGPCREICDKMEVTRTEEQCRKQCSEYLVSLSCMYDEYYDDNVNNCAPCSEICKQHETTDTTEECASKCRSYLTAMSCKAEEYFEEERKVCAQCSDLCSHESGVADTPDDCFKKCSEYPEKNPPGRLIDGNRAEIGDTGKSSQPPSSSPHPGIIIAIVIGVLILGGVMGTASLLYCRFKSRSQNYHPAPRNDGDADGGGDGADVRDDDGHNDEVRVQMEELRPAVPVSSEDVQQLSSASAEVLNDRQEDVSRVHTQHQSGVKYGIPECDPLAPSSAAYRHVTETETVL